jgi:hypothetical protein
MKTLARDVLHSLRARRALRQWRKDGCQSPPPPAYKQATVRRYARLHSLETFIETGTLYGDMVYAVRRHFRRIISIELSKELAAKAQSRFRLFSHISVTQGDSAEVLSEILSNQKEPALFWLDAHFSGNGTARGKIDTPIIGELGVILSTWIDGSIALIDDARYFVGRNGYPTMSQLADFVKTTRPSTELVVENDIICLS